MKIGLGLGVNKSKASSINYSDAAKAFFTALPTQPSSFMKNLYNNFYKDLGSEISKVDAGYINWAELEDNLAINLANPGVFTKTKIGLPVFNKYIGVYGATGTAYDLNFIPATDGINFGLNNNGLSVWLQSDRLLTVVGILGCANAGEHGSIKLFPYNFPPKSVYGTTDPFKNGSSQAAYTDVEIQELWSFTWDGVNFKLYHNGVLKETVAGAVCTLPVTFSFTELAQNLAGTLTGSYNANIGALFLHNDSIDIASLYTSLKNFNDALPIWTGYGDSLTSGYLLSDPRTQCWLSKVCAAKGLTPFNQGVPNATIVSFDTSTVQIKRRGNAKQRVSLAWNLNDFNTYDIATFQAKLQNEIDRCIAAEYTAQQIVGIDGYSVDQAGNQHIDPAAYNPYVVAAAAVFAANGVQHVDLSQLGLTVANGKLQADGIHATDLGTTDYANYVIANTI